MQHRTDLSPTDTRDPITRGDADDPALLAALRDGEPAAFERLVREHGGALLRIARRLLRNEDDARDAVQEALLSAHRNLGRFEGRCRLSTWLYRITVNAARMRRRSRARRVEVALDDLLPGFDAAGNHAGAIAAWHEPASAHAEREELRASVRECIDQLPDGHRTVVLLRDVEQLDTAAVAAILGVTVNAVKIRLHRARIALRALLEQRGILGG